MQLGSLDLTLLDSLAGPLTYSSPSLEQTHPWSPGKKEEDAEGIKSLQNQSLSWEKGCVFIFTIHSLFGRRDFSLSLFSWILTIRNLATGHLLRWSVCMLKGTRNQKIHCLSNSLPLSTMRIFLCSYLPSLLHRCSLPVSHFPHSLGDSHWTHRKIPRTQDRASWTVLGIIWEVGRVQAQEC